MENLNTHEHRVNKHLDLQTFIATNSIYSYLWCLSYFCSQLSSVLFVIIITIIFIFIFIIFLYY